MLMMSNYSLGVVVAGHNIFYGVVKNDITELYVVLENVEVKFPKPILEWHCPRKSLFRGVKGRSQYFVWWLHLITNDIT